MKSFKVGRRGRRISYNLQKLEKRPVAFERGDVLIWTDRLLDAGWNLTKVLSTGEEVGTAS